MIYVFQVRIFNKTTNMRAKVFFLLLENNWRILKSCMQQLTVFSFILHRKCRFSESSLWDTWICGSRSYKLWTYWIWNRYVEYRSYLLHLVSTLLFVTQILTVYEHMKFPSTPRCSSNFYLFIYYFILLQPPTWLIKILCCLKGITGELQN